MKMKLYAKKTVKMLKLETSAKLFAKEAEKVVHCFFYDLVSTTLIQWYNNVGELVFVVLEKRNSDENYDMGIVREYYIPEEWVNEICLIDTKDFEKFSILTDSELVDLQVFVEADLKLEQTEQSKTVSLYSGLEEVHICHAGTYSASHLYKDNDLMCVYFNTINGKITDISNYMTEQGKAFFGA